MLGDLGELTMATAIITSVTRTIDTYATSINSEYVSNYSNVLRRITAAIHEAFGSGAHILLDDDGKPINGQTFGIRFENPCVSDGRYTLTFSVKGDRICDIHSLGNIARPIYDERVVRQVVERALGRVGIVLGEMTGFKFPNIFSADVRVTVATTDEQHATVVIEITDKSKEAA